MTDVRDQLQASLGSAYTIERELGGGGMSRVFVAEEAALGRRVVVKVLPPELAGLVSEERFKREIALAARLQHPHIVPLLAAGEVAGLPYYTMPFVEGQSLRARLARGELPIAEAVSVLRDVARALEYAHGKGVTHRDIKPDNVLLAGTSAVITDFGVAKAIVAARGGDDRPEGEGPRGLQNPLTSLGIALGTPAYMAPEQAAGDPAIDHRADLYAFGVVAYELLAGHAPFAGRSAHAMLAAHAVEAPTPIATLRPATPPALAELVMRCLEKRPGDRPQSATDILRVLDATSTSSGGVPMPRVGAPPDVTSAGRRPRQAVVVGALAAMVIAMSVVALVVFRGARDAGPSSGGIRSIAVLPFENKSGDTTFDYLEDGITDHVRDALSALPELTVKARSSSQLLKGRDAHEVGTKLGVGAVLQGTVSGSRERVHVTAELVRASDDDAVWSGTFDGPPNEIAAMQDTILRAIRGKLALHAASVSSRPLAAGGARGTTDAAAYDLFLRGRHALDRQDYVRAEQLFLEAFARDSRFARARADIAVARAGLPLIGGGSVDSLDAAARVDAEVALALDSTVIEGYIAQSLLAGNEMRLADQLPPLERALAIDSTNAELLDAYAVALGSVGRVQDGLSAARRAREQDPLSESALGIYASYLTLSGRRDEGLAEFKAAIDLDPNATLVHRARGFAFVFAGKPDSAVAELETAFRIDSTMFGGRSNLVFGYAAAGRWSDAARVRAQLDREQGGNSPNFQRMIAAIAFGEYDKAMAFLERSVSAREPMLWPTSLPCDPTYDPLKANPRFAALMQRLGARACAPTIAWPIGKRPN
jgi:serine/threonine-protein kinase